MDANLYAQLQRERDLHALSTLRAPRTRKPGTDIRPAMVRASSRTIAARRELNAFNTYTVVLPTPRKTSF